MNSRIYKSTKYIYSKHYICIVVVFILLFNFATQYYPTKQTIKDAMFHRVIDLKNFAFLINEEGACEKCSNRFLLIILVHTAIANIEKRTAIRNTWGKQSNCTKVLFFIGSTDNEADTLKIQTESEEHHDQIQGNFMDTYHNMTYKHVMALKWAAHYCQKAKYVVKTDDDVLVNRDLLYEKLEHDEWGKTRLIACTVLYNAAVQRPGTGSKWTVTKEEYPDDVYPTYCLGPFIIYSADVVRLLLEESTKAPFFWIDDVHVTGTLAKRIGDIRHIDLRSRYLDNKEYLMSKEPKLKKYVYGPIELSTQDIYDCWEAMKD